MPTLHPVLAVLLKAQHHGGVDADKVHTCRTAPSQHSLRTGRLVLVCMHACPEDSTPSAQPAGLCDGDEMRACMESAHSQHVLCAQPAGLVGLGWCAGLHGNQYPVSTASRTGGLVLVCMHAWQAARTAAAGRECCQLC